MNPKAPQQQQATTVPVTPAAVLEYQRSIDQAKTFVSREINLFRPNATFTNLLSACSEVSEVGVAAQKAHHKILNHLASTFAHISKEHADKLQTLQNECNRLKEANEKQKEEIGELKKQLDAIFQTVLSRAVDEEQRGGGEGGSA